MRPVPVDSPASYAAEVARLLWPEPWAAPHLTRARHRTTTADRDAYLFPSRRRPRILVPVDVPGSSSMLRRLGRSHSGLAGPARGLLERSVRSRAFALARWPMLRVPAAPGPDADSIERHLADCFGTEVRVGVLLGTRRVNQKPVLQVFDLAGRLQGYAKVGHNPLTAALVRREAASLATVGGYEPRSFRVPRLLQHDQWAGLEVLVISALATDLRSPVPRGTRMASMREVTQLGGTVSTALSESGFWARLLRAVETLSQEPDGRRLRSAASAIQQCHGGEPVSFGAWHGDWGSWNMGMKDTTLQVWDWERFDPEVPVGFDGLHFAAQSVRPGQHDERRREESFLRSIPATLSELGVPPGQHDLTVRLYLLEIAVRYAEALTHGATPALRRRTSWVLSLSERLGQHPSPALSEGRR